jgi:hypothetical protein
MHLHRFREYSIALIFFVKKIKIFKRFSIRFIMNFIRISIFLRAIDRHYYRMHSNLASFKKPKIQFSQCQDAQTPNKPVSKQPTFIMPTFKTPSFVVSRLVLNMRNKKYCNIAEQFNMATVFLAITQ